MPGPAGFDATRMFQLADKAGELTEDIWEACGEPTTLNNARRAYKKYYEAKERHELDNRLEEELRPTPKKKKAGAHKPAAKSSDGGSSSRKRKEPESEAGSSSGGRAGVESTQTPVRKTSHQRERELECREEPSSSRGPTGKGASAAGGQPPLLGSDQLNILGDKFQGSVMMLVQ